MAHSSVWSHIQHALPDTEAEEEIQQLNPAFMELGARVVSQWTLEPYDFFQLVDQLTRSQVFFAWTCWLAFKRNWNPGNLKLHPLVECPVQGGIWRSPKLTCVGCRESWTNWGGMLSNTGRLFNPCGSCHHFLSGQFVKNPNEPTTTPNNQERIRKFRKKGWKSWWLVHS